MHAHAAKHGGYRGEHRLIARAGDPVAMRVVDQYCTYLAIGLGGLYCVSS